MASEDRALARKKFGGSWVGAIAYWIFHLRKPLLWFFVLVTVALGLSATRLEVQAGFTKMIPLQHEYMRTFVDYQKAFGGANKVLVALRSTDGDIYSAEYLDKLKQLHEDLFYLHGVERASVLSLYSPNAIFIEVVEDGFKAGTGAAQQHGRHVAEHRRVPREPAEIELGRPDRRHRLQVGDGRRRIAGQRPRHRQAP